MKKNVDLRGRAGFTLIEVLVTLILLAVLAAAVFPIVTQQADKADPTRVAGDLASIRSGVEAFRLDVRPYFPEDLEDLVYPISSLIDDPLLPATSYAGNKADKWDGPYIDAGSFTENVTDVINGDSIPTAFEGQIQSALICVAATGAADSSPCAAGEFVAATVTGIDATEAAELEETIDGPAGSLTTGKFRHAGGVTTTAYYVLSPYF